MTLMSTRGREGISINEITDAADVSFGSFYNYFESKDDIFNQLADEVVDAFGDALNAIAESTDDPAEILAASVRSVLLRAAADPVWGRFFIRFVVTAQLFLRKPGGYFLRDVQRGFDAGRFRAADPLMAITAVGGTIISAAVVAAEMPAGATLPAAGATPVHLDKVGLPERAATVILQILGLGETEAAEVAHRPMPPTSPVVQ